MTTCNFKLNLNSISVLDEPEPFSVSDGALYPILAQHTTRYDVLKTWVVRCFLSKILRLDYCLQCKSCTLHRQIRNVPVLPEPNVSDYMIRKWNFGFKFIGLSPIYMPPQWSAFIQPEGKEYFYRNSGLPVVTEAHMYDPKTANKVCAWATEVERQAENQGLVLDRNMELFLEIDENNCSYYLVDRTAQTLFWLTEYSTTELGLQPAVSDSHLSKYRTVTCEFRVTNDFIRIITRSTILEPYRKFLHAFWWFATKGYRRSHTGIFTCPWWSVFKIGRLLFSCHSSIF